MQKCPYCLSEISEKAKKCKHCWEWVEQKKSEQYWDKKINWVTSSVRRLIIVLYFLITIPAFFIILYLIWDNYWPSYYYGYSREWWPTILRTILLPIIYIILTDILRGAVYYITTWKYELYIWGKLKPFIKKLFN